MVLNWQEKRKWWQKENIALATPTEDACPVEVGFPRRSAAVLSELCDSGFQSVAVEKLASQRARRTAAEHTENPIRQRQELGNCARHQLFDDPLPNRGLKTPERRNLE